MSREKDYHSEQVWKNAERESSFKRIDMDEYMSLGNDNMLSGGGGH